MDQLGDRGPIWNANGEEIEPWETYPFFIENAKHALGVDFVFNAVSQYGQSEIAQSCIIFRDDVVEVKKEVHCSFYSSVLSKFLFGKYSLAKIFSPSSICELISDLPITLRAEQEVKKVWMASPDILTTLL